MQMANALPAFERIGPSNRLFGELVVPLGPEWPQPGEGVPLMPEATPLLFQMQVVPLVDGAGGPMHRFAELVLQAFDQAPGDSAILDGAQGVLQVAEGFDIRARPGLPEPGLQRFADITQVFEVDPQTVQFGHAEFIKMPPALSCLFQQLIQDLSRRAMQADALVLFHGRQRRRRRRLFLQGIQVAQQTGAAAAPHRQRDLIESAQAMGGGRGHDRSVLRPMPLQRRLGQEYIPFARRGQT